MLSDRDREQQNETVSRAALRYKRAAQVAADAALFMYDRMTGAAGYAVGGDRAAQVVSAAIPSLMDAILGDLDVMEPGAG